jgi:hypothetical protein
MKHVVCVVAAALASLGITLILSTLGTHGPLGSFAVYAGYPGGFINWRANPGRVSYLLIGVVNAAVYFGILEVLGLLGHSRDSSDAGKSV